MTRLALVLTLFATAAYAGKPVLHIKSTISTKVMGVPVGLSTRFTQRGPNGSARRVTYGDTLHVAGLAINLAEYDKHPSLIGETASFVERGMVKLVLEHIGVGEATMTRVKDRVAAANPSTAVTRFFWTRLEEGKATRDVTFEERQDK